MRQYLAQGMTQQQIVDAWEVESGVRVARSSIALAIKRYGMSSAKPRPRYADLVPWRVSEEHNGHYDLRMLRAEARLRRGGQLEVDVAGNLDTWKEGLGGNVVIHYDSATPEGFHRVWREAGDDDLIHYPPSDPRSPEHEAHS